MLQRDVYAGTALAVNIYKVFGVKTPPTERVIRRNGFSREHIQSVRR